MTSATPAGRRDLARRGVDCDHVLEPAGGPAAAAADGSSRPSRASPSARRSSTSASASACAPWQPNTRYTITVDAAWPTGSGSGCPGHTSRGSAPATERPRLDVETGAWVVEANRPGYPAWARNLTRIEADVAAVPEAKLGELRRPARLVGRGRVDVKKVGPQDQARRPSRSRDARTSGTRSRLSPPSCWAARRRPPASTTWRCAPRRAAPGRGQPPPREMLLNFTNLGVTAKLSGPSGLVWVTRLSDGQPQPGAEITIRDAQGEGPLARDDRRGRRRDDAGPRAAPAQGQAPAAQRAPPARRTIAAPTTEGRATSRVRGLHRRRQPPTCWCSRALGKDMTWVNPNATGGLAAWNFHVPVDTSARAEQLRGFLHTDRGLYRPGDTVRLKGLARVMKLGGGAARAVGAQGARHRARSARRGAAGEERSAQPLRRLRVRRADWRGRAPGRLPRRGVAGRRRVP